MSTNNPEIRALTLDEIDIVSGGAGKLIDLWGVSIYFAPNGCMTASTSSEEGGSVITTSVTSCPAPK